MTKLYRPKQLRFTLQLTALLSVSALFLSCSDDKVNVGTGSGRIIPVITVDTRIIPAADPNHTFNTESAPDANDMTVRLTDNLTGATTTWQSVSDIQSSEVFLPGEYTIQAYSGSMKIEGFEKPFFYGSDTFTLNNGETVQPEITCSLLSTVIEVEYTESYRKMFADYSVTLHSDEGGYIEYSSTEKRPAYLIPGDISLTLFIEMRDGRTASFQPVKVSEAKPGHLYKATLTAIEGNGNEAPRIIISFDDKVLTDDVTVSLTDAFFNADTPLIDPVGFTPGTVYSITEGTLPEEPIAMKVFSSDLSALVLTTISPSLTEKGWPGEVNLLDMKQATADSLKSFGLSITDLVKGSNSGSTIDLTNVLRHLKYSSSAHTASFTLQARNRTSKVSSPLTLSISIEPVDLSVVSWTSAIVGINRAELRVKCPSSAIEENVTIEVEDERGRWSPLKIIDIESVEGSIYAIRFDVPAGNNKSLNIRVKYCGDVKQTLTIKRESPVFSIDVDAYALSALVRIIPEDPELKSLITSCASIYASGRKLMSLERYSEEGAILVSGLAQSTRYSFQATVMADPTEEQMSKPVEITTETCVQIPNSNFEDVRNTIDYPDMLSGGRYSQTVVGIFNLQNRTTFSLSTPRNWANVNDKTFCSGAKNHNTWYMAPSTYTVTDAHEGAYAVRIDNVGWDIDGQPIPDYRQTGQPYTSYSLNIPDIAHRAAGRLFLGSYSFDPMTGTETYSEGIRINSRPVAVSGYYKYIPAQNNPSDRAIVITEITGMVDNEEIVIASGKAELSTSLSYKAFAVPLEYKYFGIKAHRIKLMFAGSASMGSIETESDNVITFNDPVTSTSKGSSLWIDDINLTY